MFFFKVVLAEKSRCVFYLRGLSRCMFCVGSVEDCGICFWSIWSLSLCSRNPERIHSLVNSLTINGPDVMMMWVFKPSCRGISSIFSPLPLFTLSSFIHLLLFYSTFFIFFLSCLSVHLSIMAPRKPEQKKEAVKMSSDPEMAKEPDFNPHSIKVCLSAWLSFCLFFCLSFWLTDCLTLLELF